MIPHILCATRRSVRLAVATLLAVMLVAAPSSSHAAGFADFAEFTVTRFDDPAPNGCKPDDCSLREAIIAANVSSGYDRITLSSGTYTLSIAGTGDNTGATGDLDIASDITLKGAGAKATTIDASGIDRVFDILSGSLIIDGITIQHGAAGSGNDGGSIRNAGALRLWDSAVISSTAGVLFNFEGGQGGGIFSTGPLELTDSTIGGNTSDSNGGGVYSSGTLTIRHSLLANNITGDAGSGGLRNGGKATIQDSVITKNKAVSMAGGIGNGGTMELTNSQVTYNFVN